MASGIKHKTTNKNIHKGKNHHPRVKKVKKDLKSSQKLTINFNILALLIITIMGFITYSSSLNGEMIYDDLRSIVTNEDIHDLGNFSNIEKWTNPNQRYFAYFTFAVNYSIHQDKVFGYHLFNLIIHLLYSFFIFLLAKLILSIKIFDNDPQRKQPEILALFIALICLLHPIQTQAVSYIVQRMASMATMFYIMSVYFYGRGRVLYAEKGLTNKVISFYIFSLVSGILGIMTKQIIATLPAALLLFEFFFIRTKDGKIFKKYLIISFSIIFLLFLIVIFGGYLPRETDNITRSEYLFTQTRVIVKYIQLLFLPVNQALNYDFSISKAFLDWKVILSTLFLAALLAFAIIFYKRKHLISFGIIWFFLTLLIESSLIPIIDVIFEHRLYLPMFGFSIIVTSIIWDVLGKKSYSYVFLLLIALNVVYAVSSFERNKVWKSQIDLWTDNIKKYPDGEVLYINRAFAYTRKGRYQEAIADYDSGIKINASNYDFYINRALANKILKNYSASEADYSQAIEKRDTNNYQAYLERGILYTDHMNEYEKGIEDFKTFLKGNPGNFDATLNIALTFYKMHEFDSALVYCRKSNDLVPEDGKAYYITAITNAALKDFTQAYDNAVKAQSLGYQVEESMLKDWKEKSTNTND